jgi:hypothetical protein
MFSALLSYNNIMLFSLLSWWYDGGLKQRIKLLKDRQLKTMDYFSLDLLVKTWFAPFRQISAESVRGSLDLQMRAWFDKLLSRIIGGFMRTALIIIGIIVLATQAILNFFELIIWTVMPLMPMICLVLFIWSFV